MTVCGHPEQSRRVSHECGVTLLWMREDKTMYYVYILTNKSHTLYIGVTSDLIRRLHEHKQKYAEGFTKRYNINKLLYVEEYPLARDAIGREKQLKGWSRKKKIELIKTINPTFRELIP